MSISLSTRLLSESSSRAVLQTSIDILSISLSLSLSLQNTCLCTLSNWKIQRDENNVCEAPPLRIITYILHRYSHADLSREQSRKMRRILTRLSCYRPMLHDRNWSVDRQIRRTRTFEAEYYRPIVILSRDKAIIKWKIKAGNASTFEYRCSVYFWFRQTHSMQIVIVHACKLV